MRTPLIIIASLAGSSLACLSPCAGMTCTDMLGQGSMPASDVYSACCACEAPYQCHAGAADFPTSAGSSCGGPSLFPSSEATVCATNECGSMTCTALLDYLSACEKLIYDVCSGCTSSQLCHPGATDFPSSSCSDCSCESHPSCSSTHVPCSARPYPPMPPIPPMSNDDGCEGCPPDSPNPPAPPDWSQDGCEGTCWVRTCTELIAEKMDAMSEGAAIVELRWKCNQCSATLGHTCFPGSSDWPDAPAPGEFFTAAPGKYHCCDMAGSAGCAVNQYCATSCVTGSGTCASDINPVCQPCEHCVETAGDPARIYLPDWNTCAESCQHPERTVVQWKIDYAYCAPTIDHKTTPMDLCNLWVLLEARNCPGGTAGERTGGSCYDPATGTGYGACCDLETTADPSKLCPEGTEFAGTCGLSSHCGTFCSNITAFIFEGREYTPFSFCPEGTFMAGECGMDSKGDMTTTPGTDCGNEVSGAAAWVSGLGETGRCEPPCAPRPRTRPRLLDRGTPVGPMC